MPKRFAISDIHGNAKSFRQLIHQLSIQAKDQLFLLGDYIDRGPDSKGVIDFIWELQAQGVSVVCLRGNHEQLMLEAREQGGRHAQHWINRCGGDTTLRSFGSRATLDSLPERYWDWLRQLPYYHELEDYFLVHAGLNFQTEQPLKDREAMLWIRYWYDDFVPAVMGGRQLLHGHTPQDESDIRLRKSRLESFPVLNIDNGCYQYDKVGRGQLCAFDLNEKQLHFQVNIDVNQHSHDPV